MPESPTPRHTHLSATDETAPASEPITDPHEIPHARPTAPADAEERKSDE
jgi:hypothetical protein